MMPTNPVEESIGRVAGATGFAHLIRELRIKLEHAGIRRVEHRIKRGCFRSVE